MTGIEVQKKQGNNFRCHVIPDLLFLHHFPYDLLPDTKPLVRMGEYCREIGFTAEMVKQLVGMQPVRFSGRLYSHEFTQRFETTNSEARLERDPKRPGFFNLLIDGTDIIDWFQQKYADFRKAIGIPIKPNAEQNQSRGRGI